MNIWNELTTNISIYGGVAALLPLLVSIINRPTFPAHLRQVIMVVLSVIVAIVTYGAKNGWEFNSTSGIITAVLGVALGTQVAYLLLWKRGVAPALERNVNGGKQPAALAPLPEEQVDESDPFQPDGYDDPIPEGVKVGPADEPAPVVPPTPVDPAQGK